MKVGKLNLLYLLVAMPLLAIGSVGCPDDAGPVDDGGKKTDDGEDGPSSTGHTTITFPTATDTVGDFVELVCDGSNFYCHGQAKADGGIALALP